MKKIVLAAIATVTLASTASAGCNSYGGYTTCTNGNTYNTIGNTTYGYNYNTGSYWSQTTTGGLTYGYDKGGNYWSRNSWWK